MVGRTGFCLLFILLGLVETVTSQTGLYTSKTYGCKIVYNFSSNVISAVFNNSFYGIKENVTASNFPVVIKIPANSSISLSIKIIEPKKHSWENEVQNSSELCCDEMVKVSGNCFTFNLTCPEKCAVSQWPDYLPDFYKTPDCTHCTCQYCYIGSKSGWRQLKVPTYNYTEWHLFNVNLTLVKKNTTEIIENRKKFKVFYRLPSNENADLLPIPQNSLFRRYFDIFPVKGTFEMRPTNFSTLPKNGQLKLYLHLKTKDTNVFSVLEYHISWYSQLVCRLSNGKITFFNDPLLKINCNNTIKKPIIYNVSPSQFQMKENSLLLKDLTSQFNGIINLSAMYDGFNDSQVQIKIKLDLSASSSLLTVHGCKAEINFGLLKYSSLTVMALGSVIKLVDRPVSYVIHLPSNKTTTLKLYQEIENSTIPYTITATTSEICCNDTVVEFRLPICFRVDLNCSKQCQVVSWPQYKEFYKISSCDNCECRYCYVGSGTGKQQLTIPLRTYNHSIQVNVMEWYATKVEMIKPRNFFFTPYSLPKDGNFTLLPVQNYSNFHEYFDLVFTNDSSFLQVKDKKTFPLNGRVKLHIYSRQYNYSTKGRIMNIIWYSPLKCNVSRLFWNRLNVPLQRMDCENFLQLPVEYTVNNMKFQMKNNFLYLKELTANGSFNISITAMFEGRNDSKITVNIPLTLKGSNMNNFFTLTNCNASFNFDALNYTSLNLYSQQVGLNITSSNTTNYVTSLPSNEKVIFYVRINEDMVYTTTVITPVGCCNNKVVKSGNCYKINMVCPNKCPVSYWPKYTDFYRTTDCINCSCQYCYIGNRSTDYKFAIPIENTTYPLQMQVSGVEKTSIVVIKRRRDFLNPVELPDSFFLYLLPHPKNSIFDRYFTLGFTIYSLHPKNFTNLPRYGNMSIYFQLISFKPKIIEYQVIWVSPIKCKVTEGHFKYRNDPLLHIDCENDIKRPIIFHISDPFLMKNNSVYLKDLTVASGNLNMSITAMFEGLIESATTFDIPVKLTGPHKNNSILNLHNCDAIFDFGVLNYKSLNLYSPQLGLNITLLNTTNYVTVLSSNETIIFHLKVDEDIEYTIKVVTPEYCCNASIIADNLGLCFNVTLTCLDSCQVLFWLDFVDFYKFSECKGCECSYCYIGERQKNISLFIPMKSFHYELRLQLPPANKYTYQVVLPHKNLLSNFQFPSFQFLSSFRRPVILPVPWGSSFLDFFAVDYSNSTISINLNETMSLPQNGRFQMYLYQQGSFNNTLWEYDIKWISVPRCNVSYLPWNFFNDPLLSVDCDNILQRPIVFISSDENYQMKNNLVYLRNLLTNGTFNISITAMYEGMNNSATNINTILTVKGNSSFLKVYGCKVVIDYRFLQGPILISNENALNISSLTHHAIISVPENKKNIIYIESLYRNVTFSFTVTSPEQCCQTGVKRSGLCFDFYLNCNESCPVTTWPEFPNFFRTSKCGLCDCQYCSQYSLKNQQMLLLPLNTSTTHLLMVGPMSVKKNVIKLKLPKRKLQNFQLYKRQQDLLSVHFSFDTNFTKHVINESVFIQINNLTRNGQEQIYLQRKEKNVTVVDEYIIDWFSPPRCKVNLLFRKYLNSPLLQVNCEKAPQTPITFNLTERDFQMKDNLIYLKNLTANGSFNILIYAMYKDKTDLSDFTTALNFSLTLNATRILKFQGCKAIFNTRLLNYTSLNIFSKKHQYNTTLEFSQLNHTVFLHPNDTYIFYLTPKNQHMNFTLTAKSPEYCCSDNITYHDNFGCYTLRLQCSGGCNGIYPETRNFYVIPGTSNCSSIYCYRGGIGGKFQMSLTLPRNVHNYSVDMPPIKRKIQFVQFLIERKEIKLKYPQITNKTAVQVWPRQFNSYVKISFAPASLSLVSDDNSTLEGHFRLILSPMYALRNSFLTQNITDFSVYVFKKVHCNIVKLNRERNMWPLPMYLFNCSNPLKMNLSYNVEPSTFFVKQSILYMNWAPRRNSSILVNVTYENLTGSKSTYIVKISLKKYFMSLKSKAKWLIELLASMVKVEGVVHRPGNITDVEMLVPSGKAVRQWFEKEFSSTENEFTILEYYATVGRLYITNLTVVQNDKNRYTFTCRTNNTFTDLTYKWYWNGFEIFKDISSSMQDGKSQGRITLSGLNKKDSGNVTCSVRKNGYIPATKTSFITMKSFPEVRLNATYHIIQKRKPVNVTCELFPMYEIPEIVFKVNNQTVSGTKVTLLEEATVSCFGVYKGLTGEIKTLQILKAVGKTLCAAEIYDKIEWPETIADTTAYATCSGEYYGTISRFCFTEGTWGEPDKSNCVKKLISDTKSRLDRIAIGIEKGFESAVENLANATKESIDSKDITETIDALKVASIITNQSKVVTKKEIKNVVNVVNNLIESDTKTAWTKLEDKNELTAASILKLTEDFGNVASQKINETVSVSTDNIVIEYEKVDVENSVQFPAKNSTQPKWVKESVSQVFIPSALLKNKFGANETVSMNAVIFRNLKDLLPQSKNSTSSVNSYVLAISFGKKLVNLTENAVLSFTHLSPGYEEPSCNFWDFDIKPEFGGYWSTSGCQVSFSNSTFTECSCDHLTNFAILMNVVAQKDRKVLGIITKVGCSISIVTLILTIIVYVICWKSVTSQDVAKSQSILLMNLCVSLIIAYVIFLTLVQGPREKHACTAIAAILHYFFLVVFFTMFAEGVDMAIALTIVFSPKFNRLTLLMVTIWVAPLLIVSISLGSTQTRGFGNEDFCWLTQENYVIWSFVIPALLIILSNFVCVGLILKSLFSSYCMLRENVKERLRTGARAVAILTPLLGFTWLFGIFAVNEDTVVFEYIFTVSSSLQGLFIFLAYCIFNKQIRKGLRSKEKTTTQTPTKQSTQIFHGTKLTELSSSSKSGSKISASITDSSDIDNDFNNGYCNFSDLRYSGLSRPIVPYYINPTMKTSLNGEK